MVTTDISRRWFFGPLPDLVLGCGLFYTAIFGVLVFAGAKLQQLVPTGLIPLLVLVSGLPHYGATLLRVYENREDRRAYRVFTVFATIALVFVFAGSVHSDVLGSWVLTIYLTWSPWHYSGQNYGITLMFLRRRGFDVTPSVRRFLYASFMLSFLLTVVSLHGASGQYAPVSYSGTVYRLIPLGIPPLVAAIGSLLLAAFYVISLLGTAFLLLRQGRVRDLLPVAVLISSQALWFAVPTVAFFSGLIGSSLYPLSVADHAYAFLWVAIGHSLQYVWITSYYAARSPGFRSHRVHYAKTLLAGAAVWVVPGLLFAPFALGRIPFDAGLLLMVASVVNIHHFILDGAIWKLRDGRIARILIRGDRDAEPAPPTTRSVSWIRPAVWVAGAVSIVIHVTATLEREFGAVRPAARGDYERVERAADRLAWLTRDSAKIRIRSGVLRARAGDTHRGVAQVEQALRLHGDSDNWSRAGEVYQLAGREDDALAAYRKALELSARPLPQVNINLALLLVSRHGANRADVTEAIRLAREAADVLGDRHPLPPDTLAAAYAASGRFHDAQREARRALELARGLGDAALVKKLESRLASYRARVAGDGG